MSPLVAGAFGFVLILWCAGPVQSQLRYQPELDYVNVDEYLRNDALMEPQVQCVLHDGPCDNIGQWVKARATAAFMGQCPLCTPKQQQNIQKILSYMMERRPAEYKEAIIKYLNQAGINVPDQSGGQEY